MDPDSRVVLHDLRIHREDGDVLAGRLETGVFVALPELGAEIIAMLGDGMAVGAVGDRLRQEHGADVDVDGFVGDLLGLGFVKAVDGHLTAAGDDGGLPRTEWNWLSPSAAAAVFSRPVKALWLAALGAAVVALVLRPSLFPRPGDLYWTPSSTVVLLTTTAFAIATSLVHESAHLAAARSCGIAAGISLSTRLGDLVIQTRATALWSVPRHQRYRFYLAGMACDLALLSALILTQAALNPGSPVGHFLAAASVLILLRLAWQAGLYTRTDLYLVVMDAVRCRNLFDDAAAYARFWIATRVPPLRAREPAPGNPLDAIPDHERPWIKAYALVMVAGSALAVALGVAYGVPWLTHLVRSTSSEIASGAAHERWAMLADGGGTLLIEGSLLALFAVTFVRGRKGRPAPAAQ